MNILWLFQFQQTLHWPINLFCHVKKYTFFEFYSFTQQQQNHLVFLIKCLWSSSHCCDCLYKSGCCNLEASGKKNKLKKRHIAIEITSLGHMMYDPTKGEGLATGWKTEKIVKQLNSLWKGWDWGASSDGLLSLVSGSQGSVSGSIWSW